MQRDVVRTSHWVKEIFAFARNEAENQREIIDVERGLFKKLMELGREALQEFIGSSGTGYQGQAVVTCRGKEKPYIRDRACKYMSVFGSIVIERAYYHEKGSHGLFPLDGRLNLPDRMYSYLLQEWAGKFAVNGSYEKARELLESIFPVHVPIRSIERIVSDACDDVTAYYEEKKSPIPKSDEVVCALVDCKGVIMRKEARPVQDTPKDPNKPGKKKMATVGAVYNIERHFRSAEEIVGEVSHGEESRAKPRPKEKRTWGSLTEDKAATVERLQADVTQRIKRGAELVCLLDGERALWTLVKAAFPTAFFVLDIFHVLERLWMAAHCFHKEGSQEAKEFVAERLRKLLCGDVGRVIGGFKQILTKRKLSSRVRYELEKVVGYLDRNKENMRYHVCLSRGYPIGSGVVEGACRNLINDRMELTGMRWSLHGAESMIRLRAAELNQDWQDFWTYRRKSERKRLYREYAGPTDELYDAEVKRAA